MTFQYSGEWRNPKQPRKRIAGTLRFDDEGAELILHDNPRKVRNLQHGEYEVLVGDTIEGKKVSLLKCFDVSTSMSSNRLSQRKVYAQTALVGVHVKEADPKVYGAEVTLRNINAWWGRSGFRGKLIKWPRAVVRFSPSRPVTLWQTSDAKLVARATLESFSSSAKEDGEYRLKEDVRLTPRWTVEKRQFMDGSKAAISRVRDR